MLNDIRVNVVLDVLESGRCQVAVKLCLGEKLRVAVKRVGRKRFFRECIAFEVQRIWVAAISAADTDATAVTKDGEEALDGLGSLCDVDPVENGVHEDDVDFLFDKLGQIVGASLIELRIEVWFGGRFFVGKCDAVRHRLDPHGPPILADKVCDMQDEIARAGAKINNLHPRLDTCGLGQQKAILSLVGLVCLAVCGGKIGIVEISVSGCHCGLTLIV